MKDETTGKPILIGGLESSGKTLIGCAILQIATAAGFEWGAMKPFDAGLLERNASELEHDAGFYCRFMAGKPAESLVSPYIAHENYPIEMAYFRDGIRIDWKLIDNRINILMKRYHQIIVELPPGLCSPLSEDMMTLDWAMSVSDQIIWVMNPQADQLEHNIIELKALFEKKANVMILINNLKKVVDTDLLFFIWEKIEKIFHLEVEGMIPHIPNCKIGSEVVTDVFNKNVPNLFKKMSS